MRRLYEAADAFEARWLADYLLQHSLPNVVLGDALAGASGQLPVNIYPAVWVLEDADWYRANRLLEAFLERPPVTARPWRCPACGESVEAGFDLCWNCGTARDLDRLS